MLGTLKYFVHPKFDRPFLIGQPANERLEQLRGINVCYCLLLLKGEQWTVVENENSQFALLTRLSNM